MEWIARASGLAGFLLALSVCGRCLASSEFEASVATHGDTAAVAWYDTRDRHAQIYVRFVAPEGEEIRLTRGHRHAYEPSLQLTEKSIVVAWYDKLPGSGDLTARLGAWSRDGTHRWTRRLGGAGRDSRNPVVRIFDDAIFCAWLEGARGKDPFVWSRWFDLEGRPISAPRRVAPASRTTWNLNAAIDDHGRPWMTFDARVGTTQSELFLAKVEAAGPRVFRVSKDDGFGSVYPDIAFSGSNVALTWFDQRDGNNEIYLYAGPAHQLEGPVSSGFIESQAHRVTETRGSSIGAYLSWNSVSGGLVWCDDTEGRYEVFFAPFDSGGILLEPPRRLSHSDAGSLIPSIATWRNGFAVAWNAYRSDIQVLILADPPAVNLRD